jgi:hypothetical protein
MVVKGVIQEKLRELEERARDLRLDGASRDDGYFSFLGMGAL